MSRTAAASSAPSIGRTEAGFFPEHPDDRFRRGLAVLVGAQGRLHPRAHGADVPEALGRRWREARAEAIQLRAGDPALARRSGRHQILVDRVGLEAVIGGLHLRFGSDERRTALARKQVRRGELGWQLELDQLVTGRIEHDPESDFPIVTIDGREFRWEHLGHMLMTFEGFNLELRVRDSIDVVGGPLLDEE